VLKPADIELRIQSFREDLAVLTAVEMIRKHIIYGECAVMSAKQYFDLRSEIANKYEVHPNEVIVVGSSKLGFSIAPTKRYRHFTDLTSLLFLRSYSTKCGRQFITIGTMAATGSVRPSSRHICSRVGYVLTSYHQQRHLSWQTIGGSFSIICLPRENTRFIKLPEHFIETGIFLKLINCAVCQLALTSCSEGEER
jgi:hypothetical protein